MYIKVFFYIPNTSHKYGEFNVHLEHFIYTMDYKLKRKSFVKDFYNILKVVVMLTSAFYPICMYVDVLPTTSYSL